MATSNGSKKRSANTGGKKTKKAAAHDAPFAPDVLKRAKKIAASYRLVLERDEDLGYVGCTVELPYVFADGETIDACAKAILEATTGAIAHMIERSERIPSPASEGRRNQQVNIRLTAEEKMLLEEAARREGFRSISDFMRSASLGRTG